MEVSLTAHAISRYIERVKPAMDSNAARAELERLVEHADITPTSTPPRWVAEGEREAYLPLTDDVCLTLIGRPGRWRALTVLLRGSLSPESRAARNEARKDRHRRARTRRQKDISNGRPR